MEKGKKICEALKALRKRIADANDIPFEMEECSRKGVVLNHVSPAQALGRHRLIVHPLSLKKAPAPWSMTYLRRLSSLPLPEEMRHSYHQL